MNWNKLFENSDQPIWIVNASWQIVLTNPALCAWWGAGGDQLAGQEIRFSNPTAASAANALAASLAPDPSVFSGRALKTEIIHPLDPARRLEVQWLPLLDTSGEVETAVAWGTRAIALEQGSPARITADTDWHALLAEHRARLRGQAALSRFAGTSLAIQLLRARAELAARQACHVWIFGP